MKRITVEYYKKNVYGVEKNYLKNDTEVESAILNLIGQKTISESQMIYFMALGIFFEQVLN